MFKAVIFDFDFTLGDSSSGIFQSVNYALRSLGYPSAAKKRIDGTIGLSLGDTLTELTGNKDLGEIKRFSEYFVEYADKVMSKSTLIYPDVPATLKSLRRKGLKLGIVSTKFRYRIEEILQNNHLRECFDAIMGGEDVQISKPDPEGLNKIIDRIRLDKNECLYVGDSLVDAKTAKNAGVPFAAVLTGTTKREEFGDFAVVSFLDHIEDIIQLGILEAQSLS